VGDGSPYVPTDSPAIGDLFELFNFGSGRTSELVRVSDVRIGNH
jgi:hypothetical protein